MRVILDRYEGDYAVVELESGELVNMPRMLAMNAEEGDIIELRILEKETDERKAYIQNLADQLFED